jgi:hypothetical protein
MRAPRNGLKLHAPARPGHFDVAADRLQVHARICVRVSRGQVHVAADAFDVDLRGAAAQGQLSADNLDLERLAVDAGDLAIGADEFEFYRRAGRDLERQLTVGAWSVRAEPAVLLVGGFDTQFQMLRIAGHDQLRAGAETALE